MSTHFQSGAASSVSCATCHRFLISISSSHTQRLWTEKFPECCRHRSSSRRGSANSQQLHPYQVTFAWLKHGLQRIASLVNVWAGGSKPVQTLWLMILLPTHSPRIHSFTYFPGWAEGVNQFRGPQWKHWQACHSCAGQTNQFTQPVEYICVSGYGKGQDWRPEDCEWHIRE